MDTKPKSKEWFKKPIFVIPIVLIVVWLILPDSTKSMVVGFFGGLMSLAIVGGIIYGIVLLARSGKKGAEAVRAAEKLKLQQPEIQLWNSLGSTTEEREKGINKLFDSNKGTVYFGTRWDFKALNGNGVKDDFFMQFRISRNLANMEKREKEFLRTTFLLYNSGKIDENQWRYYRFAFVNGDGKASIDTYNYLVPPDSGIKDGLTMVKYYQDHDDSSVDSAVNNLLKKIENIELDNNGQSLKKVKEIKRRIHGDGSWLSDDELDETVFNGNGNYKLRIGNLEDTDSALYYSGEGSLMTIAPPGSGKTQCFVIPNMLNWKGAALVLDIKGEIYDATSKWREDNVGKVYKFSPLDPKNSSSYNPMAFVREDADYIWEDSRFLADMLIVPSGASDPFWENMARDVLTAAIAYVTFNNGEEDRGMTKVLDLIYGIGWDEMITSLKTNVIVSSMRRMGNALDEMEKKQRDSVLKTAQSSLSAWQGERIAKVTNKSDWNPLDMRNGSPTIYICINPNELDSYLSVIRVFIAQHIRMLTTELPVRGSAPVLFMLDELPRLKKMPPVDEALNIGRQYGIKLWMFAQSYGQLKDAYPDPEGLLGSCAVRTFMNMPLNDEFTTRLSDQLGYRHDALGNDKEKLVSPLELAGPKYQDLILVLATGTKPAKVRKKFAYMDEELLAKIK